LDEFPPTWLCQIMREFHCCSWSALASHLFLDSFQGFWLKG
jgi:hypothetical protein